MSTPNFNFYTTLPGQAEVIPRSLGSVSNTGGTIVQPLYISHDGTADLHNVSLYVRPYAGQSYLGVYGEAQDYNRLVVWGNEADKGLIINLATNTSTTLNRQVYYDSTNQTGLGYSALSAIPLATECFLGAGSTAPGHFPAGETAHVTLFLSIPGTETAPGPSVVDLGIFYQE